MWMPTRQQLIWNHNDLSTKNNILWFQNLTKTVLSWHATYLHRKTAPRDSINKNKHVYKTIKATRLKLVENDVSANTYLTLICDLLRRSFCDTQGQLCACQVWLKFARQFLRYLFWRCVTLISDSWSQKLTISWPWSVDHLCLFASKSVHLTFAFKISSSHIR